MSIVIGCDISNNVTGFWVMVAMVGVCYLWWGDGDGLVVVYVVMVSVSVMVVVVVAMVVLEVMIIWW